MNNYYQKLSDKDLIDAYDSAAVGIMVFCEEQEQNFDINKANRYLYEYDLKMFKETREELVRRKIIKE